MAQKAQVVGLFSVFFVLFSSEGGHVAVLHFLAGYEIDKELISIDKELMNKFNRRIRNLEIARGDTLQYSTL
jgi:hypothetical protein